MLNKNEKATFDRQHSRINQLEGELYQNRKVIDECLKDYKDLAAKLDKENDWLRKLVESHFAQPFKTEETTPTGTVKSEGVRTPFGDVNVFNLFRQRY